MASHQIETEQSLHPSSDPPSLLHCTIMVVCRAVEEEEEGVTRGTHATTLQRTPATSGNKGPFAGPETAGTDSTERREPDTQESAEGTV
jgi:hypothetical protein